MKLALGEANEVDLPPASVALQTLAAGLGAPDSRSDES